MTTPTMQQPPGWDDDPASHAMIAAETAVRTAPHAMSGTTIAHSQCFSSAMFVSSKVA